MQSTHESSLEKIVNLTEYPLGDSTFRAKCKRDLDESGALVMAGLLRPEAIESICADGEANKHLAYFTSNRHNIYLTPADTTLPADHTRNREVTSSKGCITTDQVPTESALHALYEDETFKSFLCDVLGEEGLYKYADPLSSVNLHFADKGQELGWHFDNSSFAITLMVQSAPAGGVFEYVTDVRDADAGEMNYDDAAKVLDGEVPVKTLSMDAGALVLFRGRNSMHRVTPNASSRTRMLAVLAYNTEPGVALSESARMTFFGRLG